MNYYCGMLYSHLSQASGLLGRLSTDRVARSLDRLVGRLMIDGVLLPTLQAAIRHINESLTLHGLVVGEAVVSPWPVRPTAQCSRADGANARDNNNDKG